MTIKLPCGICEKPIANNHQAINCDKCGLWIHIKCNKTNKQTYIYLMREDSYCYCMLCTKTFLPFLDLNNNKFKQTVMGKQVKFTHITKQAISNAENFIQAVNSENNITKYFTIKDLNLTFNDTGNPFSFFHLNINSLSFRFDELQSLISKSKNDFQIITISETRIKKTQKIFNLKTVTLNMHQLNQLMGECCCISKKQSTINYDQIYLFIEKGNWSQFLFK